MHLTTAETHRCLHIDTGELNNNNNNNNNNNIVVVVNCNWVVTRWQWLFYMYKKYEIGYYQI